MRHEAIRAPSRGSRVLELSAVIAVSATLAGVLLERLLYYQELSEKTAVELTLLNIRSGVRQQIADKMIHARESELEQVLEANPVSWLQKPPPGYAGEISSAGAASLAGGSWFYDADRGELGYVPRLDFHLDLEPGARSLRWRARGVRSKHGGIEDLSLVAVTRYSWF
jgi:general secretion pathway protein G